MLASNMFTRKQRVALQSEFPVGDPFGGPAYGEKRDLFGGGGGEQPKADPLVGQAMMKQSQLADDVWAQVKPYLPASLQNANTMSGLQAEMARNANNMSQAQWQNFNNIAMPAMVQQGVTPYSAYLSDEDNQTLYDDYAQRKALNTKLAGFNDPSQSVGSGVQFSTSGGAMDGASGAAASSATSGASNTSKGVTYQDESGVVHVLPDGASLITLRNGQQGYLNGTSFIPMSSVVSGANAAASSTASASSGATTPGTSGSTSVDKRLAAAGIKYVEPKNSVTVGTTAMSPQQALDYINKNAANPKLAKTVAKYQSALATAGYTVGGDAGKQTFLGADGKATTAANAYAQRIKAAQDSFTQQVNDFKSSLGIDVNADKTAAQSKADTQTALDALDAKQYKDNLGAQKKAVATEGDRAANYADSSVTQAISKNNRMAEAQASGMAGYNPTQFTNMLARNSLGNAAQEAGARNTAYEAARQNVLGAGNAGIANTINTGMGLPAQSNAFMGTGGSLASGSAGTGMNALNYGTSTALNGWNNAGQLGNTQYGIGMQGWANQNANSGGGMGALLGAGAQLGSAWLMRPS